jgi:hypothetical protein
MPIVSSFYGIKILMYGNEHPPIHFHIKYGEFNAVMYMNNLGIVEGFMPGRALNIVTEWAQLHKI